ncbi:MAG: hypothetical protein HFI39_08350 [Lachnospiraceae bacterium]|nr:hypothetical protein [Lachnospiraceae bacterium]
MDKIQRKRLWAALKDVLRFEVFYKLFAICLANPVLQRLYQAYVATKGLSFNKEILGTFLTFEGAAVFAGLFLCALVLIFLEISTVLLLVDRARRGENGTLRSALMCSVWNLRTLRGWSLPLSAVYYVLLLPLVNIGYRNSLVIRVEIPWFIFGEMQRTAIGRAGMLTIYATIFFAFLFLLFVPLYMVFGQEPIGRAARHSLQSFRRLGWKGVLLVLAAFFLWERCKWAFGAYWRRNILDSQDFNRHLVKYLVQSQAFRKDFLCWLFLAVVTTAAMALFLWMLAALADRHGFLPEVKPPAWSDDAKLAAGASGRLLRRWWDGWRQRFRRRGWQLCAAAAVLWLCAGVLWQLKETPLCHRPFVIGHRGCVEEIENTLEAVTAANRLGADYAEIDVQLSADGVPVVVHDTNLWRLAGELADVRELTWEELSVLTIRADNQPGKTGRIPSLEQVLQTISGLPGEMGLLIELKTTGGEAGELAAAVMGLVEEYELGGRCLFMSLDYASILPIRERHPQWWTGYCVFGSAGELDETIWKYDIDFLAVEESLVSNQLVMQAREKELPVYVWTVYDMERMRQYLEMGVIGLITDFPEEAKEVVQAYRQQNEEVRYAWQGEGYPLEK